MILGRCALYTVTAKFLNGSKMVNVTEKAPLEIINKVMKGEARIFDITFKEKDDAEKLSELYHRASFPRESVAAEHNVTYVGCVDEESQDVFSMNNIAESAIATLNEKRQKDKNKVQTIREEDEE